MSTTDGTENRPIRDKINPPHEQIDKWYPQVFAAAQKMDDEKARDFISTLTVTSKGKPDLRTQFALALVALTQTKKDGRVLQLATSRMSSIAREFTMGCGIRTRLVDAMLNVSKKPDINLRILRETMSEVAHIFVPASHEDRLKIIERFRELMFPHPNVVLVQGTREYVSDAFSKLLRSAADLQADFATSTRKRLADIVFAAVESEDSLYLQEEQTKSLVPLIKVAPEYLDDAIDVIERICNHSTDVDRNVLIAGFQTASTLVTVMCERPHPATPELNEQRFDTFLEAARNAIEYGEEVTVFAGAKMLDAIAHHRPELHDDLETLLDGIDDFCDEHPSLDLTRINDRAESIDLAIETHMRALEAQRDSSGGTVGER